jgi:hypothetical protein
MFWMITGISAFPFVLAGEPYMAALGLASLLLALGTFLAAIGVLWRRRRSRRVVIVLEMVCLVGSAIQLALPIGSNRGLVSMIVNLGLPVAVILLLRKPREAFV